MSGVWLHKPPVPSFQAPFHEPLVFSGPPGFWETHRSIVFSGFNIKFYHRNGLPFQIDSREVRKVVGVEGRATLSSSDILSRFCHIVKLMTLSR